MAGKPGSNDVTQRAVVSARFVTGVIDVNFVFAVVSCLYSGSSAYRSRRSRSRTTTRADDASYDGWYRRKRSSRAFSRISRPSSSTSPSVDTSLASISTSATSSLNALTSIAVAVVPVVGACIAAEGAYDNSLLSPSRMIHHRLASKSNSNFTPRSSVIRLASPRSNDRYDRSPAFRTGVSSHAPGTKLVFHRVTFHASASSRRAASTLALSTWSGVAAALAGANGSLAPRFTMNRF
mmetsp:Transcript_4022/g.13455  ORF Transcript_4022/g.13455 Transcript_4022/m.13455 type:complete len:237 (+) Transcript_4022:595-1305(+)